MEAVKARVDLVEVVRRYVELRPVSGRFMAPCPFHQETKPSFSVNPDGFFYCFGCQASGDVFDFYMRMHGLEFREALEALAEEAGIQVDDHGEDPEAAKARKLKKDCLAMNALAAEHFARVLASPAGRIAQDYLHRRRVRPEVANTFGLGYAPDDWRSLLEFLRDKGFAPEAGIQAGLLAQSGGGRVYDRFRARLIFPIADLSGRIIAFGGRILEKDSDAPKYINSTETPTYTKGKHLYGLPQARPAMAKSRRAMLTEGYLDVIALHSEGFSNAVGVLGTALTAEQVKRLAGMVDHVDLVFDGDAPGRKAAAKAAELILSQGMTCSAVLLPEGLDADDVLRDQGKDAMQAMVDGSNDGLDFLLSQVRSTGSAREVMGFAERFLGGLADAKWRAFYLPRLADGLGLAEAELARGMGSAQGAGGYGQRRAGRPAANQPSRRRGNAAGKIQEPWGKRDLELLQFAVRHPECRDELAARGMEGALGHERSRGLWRKMLAYGDSEVFTYLDDGERKFWAQAKSAPSLPGEEDGGCYADICAFLAAGAAHDACSNLKAAMEAARQRGDDAEAERLFHLFSQRIGSGGDHPQGGGSAGAAQRGRREAKE